MRRGEGKSRLSIIKKDSIEIKVRSEGKKMKGKVTQAERPSQWEP